MDDFDDAALKRFAGVLASVGGEDSLRERLCEASRLMLDADGVLVGSATAEDGRVVLCATDKLSERLDECQAWAGEGPTVDAIRSGEVVAGVFDHVVDDQWPVLRELVAETEFEGTMIAVPLRSEAPLTGSLTLHRQDERPEDVGTARFLGAAVGTAMLQEPHVGEQGLVFAEVLADPELVHRATGVLAMQTQVRQEDALALLRALAFSRSWSLRDTAGAVVERRVSLSEDG